MADLDGNTVTATVSATTRGTVSVGQVGYVFTFTYTSTSGRTGFSPLHPTETFTVTFSDGHGSTLAPSFTV